MKILYICGTYAPGAFAGSELSAHQMMKQLNADPEIETLVATDQKYTGGKTIRSTYDDVMLQGIQHERRRSQVHEVISAFGPDVILTQLLWSDVTVELGESLGVPTVLRIPAFFDHQDLFKPTCLLSNSQYICDLIKNKFGRHCYYIFSTIDLHRVINPPSQRNPRFITMFNPIRDKGGHIFKEVAKSMPDKQFAVVPGWHSLRTLDGSWDRAIIKYLLESQNEGGSSWVPEDITFEEVANIFAVTRLLLVPSQYEETLARVAIEAYANGIPVIGSKIEGLQEHVRRAGYLIEDYSNPDAWVSAIRLMEDETNYFQYSEKALQFIKNDFSNLRTKDDLKRLFFDVIEAHAHKNKL
jgi:glycosyltransferase involved in cell wall biosynthesis